MLLNILNIQDTAGNNFDGPYNLPPPYSIEPEAQMNDLTCETTDRTNNGTDDTNDTQTTSAKSTLGEKFQRFRSNGESNHGFGFQRFQ